jgi:hypothetical protein
MLSNTAREKSQNERVISILALSILVGFLGIVLYALQAPSVGQSSSVMGVALMVAGASLLSGSLLGFLFGIPRTLQQERLQEPPANKQNEGSARDRPASISYQVNTNLEQISDWLTKILVGVGLTQISTLPGALQKYADYMAFGLGGFPSSKAFAIAILVYFVVCGFLVSYLWTRLYLAGALRQADLVAVGALSEKLTEVEHKMSEWEKQAEIDARALSLVQGQLNPGSDTASTPQDDLNAALKLASPNARAQIFYQAQSVRSENWRDRRTKPRMERTIPIFKALIASDTEDVYHANHGQLGFALKDLRQPDWAGAESELSKAIEIRGPWQEHGWLFYEFNRAICRINLDSAFKQGKASDKQTKQTILADLKAASNAPALADLMREEPTISSWMALNKAALAP